MTTPQELAEEFRRLAAEADHRIAIAANHDHGLDAVAYADGTKDAFALAAQMVEERLTTD